MYGRGLIFVSLSDLPFHIFEFPFHIFDLPFHIFSSSELER
jgi:hypothetical protein